MVSPVVHFSDKCLTSASASLARQSRASWRERGGGGERLGRGGEWEGEGGVRGWMGGEGIEGLRGG